ncbi:MAG: hypothetical protein LUD12_14900, partial [Lachnospiraceae bacterium]|nr:hypothetical protein [Lachnospiraceae bacterium]
VFDNIHMKSLFDRADLVVSAGGTTLYELCACGVPTISYAIADNQLKNVYFFQKLNLIDYAGDARHDQIEDNVCNLISKQTYARRCFCSLEMQKYVDGKGSLRIAKELIDSAL